MEGERKRKRAVIEDDEDEDGEQDNREKKQEVAGEEEERPRKRPKFIRVRAFVHDEEDDEEENETTSQTSVRDPNDNDTNAQTASEAERRTFMVETHHQEQKNGLSFNELYQTARRTSSTENVLLPQSTHNVSTSSLVLPSSSSPFRYDLSLLQASRRVSDPSLQAFPEQHQQQENKEQQENEEDEEPNSSLGSPSSRRSSERLRSLHTQKHREGPSGLERLRLYQQQLDQENANDETAFHHHQSPLSPTLSGPLSPSRKRVLRRANSSKEQEHEENKINGHLQKQHEEQQDVGDDEEFVNVDEDDVDYQEYEEDDDEFAIHTARDARRSRSHRGRKSNAYSLRNRVHHPSRKRSGLADDKGLETFEDDEKAFRQKELDRVAKSFDDIQPINSVHRTTSSNAQINETTTGNQKASLAADVQPVKVDSSIDWNAIGGLDEHVRKLKEMVLFPLLYPNVFDKFGVSAPKGVLFHGPPGTGKTLVARALANSCQTHTNRSVAFFMRKGADCLSKWVGETERQLRLLFEKATQMQPSIIFFDEIDGLAPVRSSKQDQIHSSIVATLLALMDGLDSRGNVIVIGATNRLDSIDPALRRPGRFDRELLFPLPSRSSRLSILRIHSTLLRPSIPDYEELLEKLADQTVGYCGSDIRALCSEAFLIALRRSYPEIYFSDHRLALDPSSIHPNISDFTLALYRVSPAHLRSSPSSSSSSSSAPSFHLLFNPRPFSPIFATFLQSSLDKLLKHITSVFPFLPSTKPPSVGRDTLLDLAPRDQFDRLHFCSRTYSAHLAHRPSMLIIQKSGMGQEMLAAALLNKLETIPHFVLDLPSLHAFSESRNSSIEAACVSLISEAQRQVPAVLYIPKIDSFLESSPPSLLDCFFQLLSSIVPACPLLIMATCAVSDVQSFTSSFDRPQKPEQDQQSPEVDLAFSLRRIFSSRHLFTIPSLSRFDISSLFDDLPRLIIDAPRARKQMAKERRSTLVLRDLPREIDFTTCSEEDVKSVTNLQQLATASESLSKDIRKSLRLIVDGISQNPQFQIFFSLPDPVLVPDYLEIVKRPITLLDVQNSVQADRYLSLESLQEDIELLVSNVGEYYGAGIDRNSLLINSRAQSLLNFFHSLIAPSLKSNIQRLSLIDGHISELTRPVPNPFLSDDVPCSTDSLTESTAVSEPTEPESPDEVEESMDQGAIEELIQQLIDRLCARSDISLEEIVDVHGSVHRILHSFISSPDPPSQTLSSLLHDFILSLPTSMYQ